MGNPITCVLISLVLVLSFTPQAFAAEYTFAQVDVPGAAVTWGLGINNSSQIVGLFKDVVGHTHGFLDVGGSLSTIDVPGAFLTAAFGINNSGAIVGWYVDQTGNHGFVDTGGVFRTIDVPGATLTRIYGINDLGQIVGDFSRDPGIGSNPLLTTSPFPPYNATGFVLNPDGTIVTLNVFGTSTSQAKGINNAGQIVGTYGGCCGFLDSSGAFTDIRPPDTNLYTGSNGINNFGQVVGFVNSSDDYFDHGFLDSEGHFTHIDLFGKTYAYASGINDEGQIVGYFTDVATSRRHGFLATPILPDSIANPEPASLVLAGSGLAVLAVFRRRIVRRPVVQ